MRNTKSAATVAANLDSSFTIHHSSLPSQWHFLVPVTGVEPVRCRHHWILSFTTLKVNRVFE